MLPQVGLEVLQPESLVKQRILDLVQEKERLVDTQNQGRRSQKDLRRHPMGHPQATISGPRGRPM